MEAIQIADLQRCPVERIAWPDAFIEHGSSVNKLRDENGLSPKTILECVMARFAKLAAVQT
jgi:1-deoxy-D-xylulose-5-phosphate synthase